MDWYVSKVARLDKVIHLGCEGGECFPDVTVTGSGGDSLW